ncbi:TPA: hypothetical protein EYP75_01195 [Candidatus Bathyarchaeota archaeon]|nr:hypothetical protein [Candidatus Bathyarchaeota archaeon]
MKSRLLPDLALKVVLSGLLDSAWGSGKRRTIVRFFVHGNRLNIGVGEGNIKKWEIDALNASPIEHEWFEIKHLDTIHVPGIKYIPGGKTSGMPRELIPVKSKDICVFFSDAERAVFPAYKCFDINLGKRRVISIISPRTLVRDVVETVHPSFPKEKYRGKVSNVEVEIESLKSFFERDYGVGILRKTGLLKTKNLIEGFPLLGSKDVKVILKLRTKKQFINNGFHQQDLSFLVNITSLGGQK